MSMAGFLDMQLAPTRISKSSSRNSRDSMMNRQWEMENLSRTTQGARPFSRDTAAGLFTALSTLSNFPLLE